MFTLTQWTNLIVAGFVYLSAGFFFYLRLSGVRSFSQFNHARAYLPYISVAAIFVSCVVGLTMHLLIEQVVVWICNEFTFTREVFKNLNTTPPELLTSYEASYRDLVMLRHLFAGTLLLTVSLPIWLHSIPAKKLVWPTLAVCAFLALSFLGAYFVQRGVYQATEDGIELVRSQEKGDPP